MDSPEVEKRPKTILHRIGLFGKWPYSGGWSRRGGETVIRRFDPRVRFRNKDGIRIAARVRARIMVRVRVRGFGLGSGLGLNPAPLIHFERLLTQPLFPPVEKLHRAQSIILSCRLRNMNLKLLLLLKHGHTDNR